MNINTNQRGTSSLKRNTSGYSNLAIKNSYVGDYVRQRTQKSSYNKYRSGAVGEGESTSSLREMMYEKRRKDKNADFYSRFAQNSYDYAESIRASRAKNKKTKSKVKKLRYSFKAISSQIMKSKTSVMAKQVAGKAKREVVRLRQKKLSAQYDPEEVQIALTHALKIERVAKKKVKHLLEEEMVKVTGGPCAGELEEREENRNGLADTEKAEDAVAAMENGMSGKDAAAMQQRRAMSSQEQAEYMQEQMEQMQDMMQAQMEKMQAQMEQMVAEMQYAMEVAQEEMQASMEDMMSEFMDEMKESMKELMGESGLSDLLDDIIGGFDREMDPADYHMMKLKHRAKELKEIAEADAEYLKAVFDRLERMKDSAVQNVFGSSDNNTDSFASVPAGGGVVVAVSTESAAEIVHESAGIGDAGTGAGTFSSASVSVSTPAPMVGGSVDVAL